MIDLRFLKDQKTFRATYFNHPNNYFWVDVTISNQDVAVRRGRRYYDRSILGSTDAHTKNYKQMRENLAVLIDEELHVGNKV